MLGKAGGSTRQTCVMRVTAVMAASTRANIASAVRELRR
jgi:hypothetical protein